MYIKGGWKWVVSVGFSDTLLESMAIYYGVRGQEQINIKQNPILTIIIIWFLEIVGFRKFMKGFPVDTHNDPTVWQYSIVTLKRFNVVKAAIGHGRCGG